MRAPSPAPAESHAYGVQRNAMTEVELIWVEHQLQHWIRFGRVCAQRHLSATTRINLFRPGAVFAFVRWTANDHGTVQSRIDIMRAVGSGEECTTVPFVRPGGELYLSLQGWPRVQAVLRAIDAVEAVGVDPCEASPDHWRHVQNRLSAGASPRLYTAQRHAAWLKRKALEA